MKLWEVIKELTEDPTKKFELSDRGNRERIGSDGNYLRYSWIDSVMISGGPALEDNVDVNNNNWQLVRQPVTWQEAIQAWVDGKKVAWEEDADRRVFDRNKSWPISKYQNHLLDQEGDAVTVRMISGGKWYVEE